MNRVLIDREQRANEIARLLHQHDVVLSIHANIPGRDKNIFPSTWLVKTLSSMEPWSNWKSFWFDSEDGAYVLILPEGIDPITLKQQTVSLEETHPLGRFIDLDVHTPKEILHRNWPRPCIVCGKDALSCRRNQRHTVEEVLEIIQSSVLDEIVPLWHEGVRLAMDKELSLDPKFGLVTPLSQGSHLDMNADLMKQAQKVILPFFSEAFRFGAVQKKIEDGVMSLRQRGINTENNMFQATQGVNCYKGLIFDLGFFSYAVGFAFAHAMSYENVRHLLTKMMMVPEIHGQTSNPSQFVGARKEMYFGLPSLTDCPETDIHKDTTLYRALRHLILSLEDTTLMRRARDVSVHEVKEHFVALDVTNAEEIHALSEWCIAHHLTFGGSADMLIVAILRDQMMPILFPSYEHMTMSKTSLVSNLP